MPAIMNFSKPLVTPEELHWLLGWPLPAHEDSPGRQAQRVQPAPATPPSAPQLSGRSLTS